MSINAYTAEKLYSLFNSFMTSRIVNTLGVAVSGGPDSMALCLIASKWAQQNNKKFIAITVDHQLRKESAQEAAQVKKWLSSHQIEHVTLAWEHGEIVSKIQEQARIARYNLMEKYCLDNGIDALCTGHHLNDQFETFMMRLSKGSGPEGLVGIKEHIKWNDLLIIRPLLKSTSLELKNYLEEINQPYIEDSSNENIIFERVRWRKQIANFSDFNLDNFSKTIDRLDLLTNFLEETLEDAYFDVVQHREDHTINIEISKLLQLHKIIAIKLLKNVLQNVSQQRYSTAHQSVKNLLDLLERGEFKGLSAGGCIIEKEKNLLLIKEDPRTLNKIA
jgi:tRNA(Ile)-lysidine synthase